jgi:hypothetical protein
MTLWYFLRSAVAAIVMLVILLASPAVAQPLSFGWMPASRVNNPEVDLHQLRRPALSLTGFDNTHTGYIASHGLGLKQVLEKRYNEADPLIVPVFDRLISLSHSEQGNPLMYENIVDRRNQLDVNTAILQGRAFEALATFVLASNGIDVTELGLKAHHEAMTRLKAALVAPPGRILIAGPVVDDYVKYSRSISNVGRALDLYLALENAYLEALYHPGLTSTVDPRLLLSLPERMRVFQEYGTVLLTIDHILGLRAMDLYASEIELPPELKEIALRMLENIPEGQRVIEEVEPGNWAMKQRLAIAYGSLAMQAMPGTPEADWLGTLLAKGIRSADIADPADDDRLKHWNFMTAGGHRFWAEGPYYLDYALEQVLPFWHALRANHMLPAGDPFFSEWFTDPLNWLADIVTPDGRTPPLDDSNKAPFRYQGLMRWQSTYGDVVVGSKYAWIDERLGGPALRGDALLVELAIPRTNSLMEPLSHVGEGQEKIRRHISEQQLVLRSTPPRQETHYLLLNGEHGAAVARGEGHEQPDQLQLLYYAGDTSYLMDSGYDRGETVANSSWNHYYDHNVMTAGDGEGGLAPPVLSVLEVRKASETWFMGEVEALNLTQRGRLSLLTGEQLLNIEPAASDRANRPSGQYSVRDLKLIRKPYQRARYRRNVLFVDGAEPYIIDINSIRQLTPPSDCSSNLFRMQYHVNSSSAVLPANYHPRSDGFMRWHAIGGRSGQYLHAFPMSVEYDLNGSGITHVTIVRDEVMERENTLSHEPWMLGKERLHIDKLVLSDPERCASFWTVATVFQISGAPGIGTPSPLWPGSSTAHQGWIWAVDDGAYDVFVVRSVGAPNGAITVNLKSASAQYPDLVLALPTRLEFGFMRLRLENAQWTIDEDYRLNLEPLLLSNPPRHGKLADPEVAGVFGLSKVYPNPFNPMATFSMTVDEDQVVRIEMFNVLGQRVRFIFEGMLSAGTSHPFTLDSESLPSGSYLIRATGKHRVLQQTVVVMK